MDFRVLADKLELLESVLLEDKGHLDHPEDAIFIGGSQYADKAIKAIEATVLQPELVTIKWDGYPALIFGRGDNGKFTIMDKHMFNKKDGTGRVNYSPKAFQQYDIARGVNREGLYPIINAIWKGLSTEVTDLGFYWGDLLFSKPLQESDGLYKFRANPGGIAYTVEPNSEIGQLMKGKVAGIAVHQYIPASAPTTDQAQSLNGTIGKIKNTGNIAVVPSKMPNTPKLKISKAARDRALSYVKKYGESVDQMLTAPAGTKSTLNSNLFTVYINKRVVQGTFENLYEGFVEYLKTRPMSDAVRAKLLGYEAIDPNTQKPVHVPGHFDIHVNGLKAAFEIWKAIYALKSPIIQQLDKASKDSPVKGYLTDGTQTQEGFVAHGFKFVDRMGFSRQNLAARG
jgi:hypothetical protein